MVFFTTMPLVSHRNLFGTARSRGFAVGFFESWDLSSLQGVIDAAELAAAPVVIGFNGDFLSGPERRASERLAWYAALGLAAAQSSTVPCGLIFNECPRDRWVMDAVDAGFLLVMPADPAADPADYRRRVKQITAYAHERGAGVEAELGELPCGATGRMVETGKLTDPDEAAAFVAETGVDLLAVSVGNVHIRLHGEQALDLKRVEQLGHRVEAGLVLHGGTGIPAADLRRATGLGVVKVNFGTYLKQAWLQAVRAALACPEINPHKLLGIGGTEDLLVAGRIAVRDAVLARMDALGCVGMASAYAPGTKEAFA